MASIKQDCRDFTIAAYSLGYPVALHMKPSEQTPYAEEVTCTWRRSGPLGSGEQRRVTITEEFTHRYAHVFDDVIVRQLVKPLVGDDIVALVREAHQRLAESVSRDAAPVELVGGARDGEVMTLRCDRFGVPVLEHLRVAATVSAPWLVAGDFIPVAKPFEVDVYHRGTINPDTGVWRYTRD